MKQATVDLPKGVDASGPNSAPDDRGGERSTAVGTAEAIWLIWVADSIYMVKHPGDYTGLCQTTEQLELTISYACSRE